MSDFARQNPGLQLAFPPASKEQHQPGRLDEVVQLTHPFLGPLVRFRDVEVLTLVSAVAAQSVLGPLVGPTECHYVPWVGIQNGGAAQNLALNMVNFTLGTQVPLRDSRQDGGGAVWPTVALWPATLRSLLVPPGFQLQAFRDVGGAGTTIVLLVAIVRLNLAEVPPSL